MVEVENRYRLALRHARNASVDTESELCHSLDRALSILPDAWRGGVVRQAGETLANVRFDAASVARSVDEAFEQAVRNQRPMVEEGTWRATWRDRMR